RADLDRVANVRVRLTDERRESVAVPVIGVLNVLQSADGNAYEVLRLLSMLDVLETVNAEIMGGGAASDIHRGMTVYLDDTGQAVAYFDDALERAQSPLIYAYRATAYLRLGEIDRALRDIETAQRLGPPDWTTPLYLLATYTTAPDTLDDSIALFNRIIALRPEDWFAPNFRGALYYLLGDYERAWADLQLAISLGPTTNFPYLTSMSIALRQGRWADFQQLIDTFITEFHDPEYSEHMVQAIYGDQRFSVFGPIFGAAGNLLLGQYEAAIAAADETLAIDDTLGDMYMIKGLARCNLGDMAGAEQAYTDGIAVDPDHMTLYAMRAEVRRRQNDWIGAMEDVDTVADSLLGAAFKPLVDAGLVGNWTCETLFDYDYSQVDE
ncbi:MAG: tetratricopeptide repeat protein, partial [Anaerolineae bacterium]|nr:tetratricopeptide repeat protein [Anaerolineae bacterium]